VSVSLSIERVGVHELSYEPEKRFNAMAKHVREPRGAKTSEHLETLRQSDPCYGTLEPLCERLGVHELPYRPERRFAALARLLREPKGAKTVEHLEALRQSDPCYGSATRAISHSVDDAAKDGVVHESASLSSSITSSSSYGSSGASDGDDEARDADLDDDGWQMLRSTTMGSGRLPRILSNHIFDGLDDDEEDEISERHEGASLPPSAGPSPRHLHTWAPPAPKSNPAYAGVSPGRLSAFRHQRLSYEDDGDSVRSMARTSIERTSERSSNNTICDFLDDASEGFASGSGSGVWSPRDSLSGVHVSWAHSRDALKAELKAELKGELAPSVALGAAPRKGGGAAKPPPSTTPAPPTRLVGGGQ